MFSRSLVAAARNPSVASVMAGESIVLQQPYCLETSLNRRVRRANDVQPAL
jgi:hypothetical protein